MRVCGDSCSCVRLLSYPKWFNDQTSGGFIKLRNEIMYSCFPVPGRDEEPGGEREVASGILCLLRRRRRQREPRRDLPAGHGGLAAAQHQRPMGTLQLGLLLVPVPHGSPPPGCTLSDRPSLSRPHRDKNLATVHDLYISATVVQCC